MKTTFYVTLDVRDDGTKVWVAKCHRCDAVIVGEQCAPITIVTASEHIPSSQIATLNREVRRAWEEARKTGNPIVVPYPYLEVSTVPDHGLQRALDAHVDNCTKGKTNGEEG